MTTKCRVSHLTSTLSIRPRMRILSESAAADEPKDPSHLVSLLTSTLTRPLCKNMKTRHFKSSNINTYETPSRKSFNINTYKNRGCGVRAIDARLTNVTPQSATCNSHPQHTI